MSEYQYYEFRAIDRSLDDQQVRELRAISTRAAISHTSFSNDYTYGDLKADPRDLLVKYFDASLQFSNWLFLEVAFRYPKGVVDVKALRRYAAGQAFDIRSKGPDIVVAISVESDGDSFDTSDDGSRWLSSLAGLRADIAGGDERALYLAWLLDVQCGVITDNALEPSSPEGLGRLSPALVSFIDIFGLDGDLVAAAAAGDPPGESNPSPEDMERWLASLGSDAHVALLSRVARGDASVAAEILRRFRRHAPRRPLQRRLRTAGELRAQAEAVTEKRRNAAREREARERDRRDREQDAARDRYLSALAKRERQAWQRVDALVVTKRPGDYDAAVSLLVDLRDVSQRKGRSSEFSDRVHVLREVHGRKPSLLSRLRKIGL